jgi:hypothetical protein
MLLDFAGAERIVGPFGGFIPGFIELAFPSE